MKHVKAHRLEKKRINERDTDILFLSFDPSFTNTALALLFILLIDRQAFKTFLPIELHLSVIT